MRWQKRVLYNFFFSNIFKVFFFRKESYITLVLPIAIREYYSFFMLNTKCVGKHRYTPSEIKLTPLNIIIWASFLTNLYQNIMTTFVTELALFVEQDTYSSWGGRLNSRQTQMFKFTLVSCLINVSWAVTFTAQSADCFWECRYIDALMHRYVRMNVSTCPSTKVNGVYIIDSKCNFISLSWEYLESIALLMTDKDFSISLTI